MHRRGHPTYGFKKSHPPHGGGGTPAQTIASVGLDNTTFTPDGISAQDVGNVVVVMSPTSPAATGGSVAIGGADAALYQLTNGGNIPCKVQAKSTTGVGIDTITLTYTQIGISNSPFTSGTITITGSTAPALTAELTFTGGTPVGGTLVYDMALGSDIGDYVAPTAGFTQKCIRVRHASLANFFIDFRPDTAGGRVEVVVWNGEVLGTVASGYTRDLTEYTLVIKNAGSTILTRVVPTHNWGCRWRYQSDDGRALVRTASQVFSEGWLPPMSSAAARISGYSGVIVPAAPTVPDASSNDGTNGDGSPMTVGTTPYVASGCIYQFPMAKNVGTNRLLGVSCAGDDGGFRPEIGIVTEWQGDWLLRGTDSSLNTFMQQAEFFSSQANAIFLPNKTTDAPINQKADATQYKVYMNQSNSTYGSYYVAAKGDGVYVSKGDEHSPQMWYLPYVLTEDPYFIEGQQYQTNYATLGQIYHKENTWGGLAGDATGQSGVNGAFTVWSYPAEERNVGWGVKNAATAWNMSPTSPPTWLLPKSVWAAFSSDYSKVIEWFELNGAGDQFYDVFHAVGSNPGDTPQSFYRAYLNSAIGFATFISCPTPTAAGQSAPPTWFANLTYTFDFFRQICDSTLSSGWNVQNPLIHDVEPANFMSNSGGAASGCTVGSAGVRPTGTNCVSTYGQLWTYCAAYLNNGAQYPGDPSPGYTGGASIGNLGPMFGAAGIAKSCGITGAANVHTFLGSMVDYSYPKANFSKEFLCQDGYSGT